MSTTSANTKAIEGLDSSQVWQIFASLSSVPRPSKDEEKVQQWALDFAQEHDLEATKDSVGNIVIRVPASKGCESAPIVVLQGHLDMVTEKNSGTEHDFHRDPIELIKDVDQDGHDIIRANGTTLGADNGMGVSLALAAAISPEVKHGPLEILLTCDEETGMTGAKSLTPGSIEGRILLNLDSEEDDALYIGCAGGGDTGLHWNLPLSAPDQGTMKGTLSVTGCKGGHSGCDIHLNRGNAIQALARTLTLGDPKGQARLIGIQGGSKRNAIPREAHAEITAPLDVWKSLTGAGLKIQEQIQRNESDIKITVESTQAADLDCASAADTRRFFETLVALPSSVLSTVPEIPGLVQTSNNLSTVEAQAGEGTLSLEVGCLSRSSVNDELEKTMNQVGTIGSLGGAKVSYGDTYPGWAPNPTSPLLASCQGIFEKTMGSKPHILSIHAGLECGIIGDRVGQIDMISFGPNIFGAHSPDERVHIDSVGKIWKYLGAVLEELSRR